LKLLYTQKMNVMFPDMTPHGMSIYVTVSPKTVLKLYYKHLILMILTPLVIGRNITYIFKSAYFDNNYVLLMRRKNPCIQGSYENNMHIIVPNIHIYTLPTNVYQLFIFSISY